ncbi:MAG: M28 family peptidase [Christensenellaceae bacterium]|jgi:hypothetical protein|nr:M28 family peptidase [Christensenellaceae bacterium]
MSELIEKLSQELCENDGYRTRRSPASKEKFAEFVSAFMTERGYTGGADGNFALKKDDVNLVYGDEKTAKIILGAHYDTSKNSATLPSFFVTNGAGIVADVFLGLFYLFLAFGVTTLLAVYAEWWIALIWFVLGCTWVGSNFYRDNKFNFNDNTSGCITLLAVADEIAKNSAELKDSVCFVFFDGEETGFHGSKRFHKKLKSSLPPDEYKKKTLLNFDCVGGRDPDFHLYVSRDDGKAVAEQIKALASEAVTIVKSPLLPTDSQAFKDIAAVTFIRTHKVLIRPLTKLDGAHTKKDNTISPAKIASVTAAALGYIKKFAARENSDKIF